MIRKNQILWRVTVLACTLAGCQNQVVPTAPDSKLAPARQGDAVPLDAIAPSQATSQSPTTQTVPGTDSTDPVAVPAATESPPIDLPDQEPEFVESELAPSRSVSNLPGPGMTLPPDWTPGQPLPPNWTSGQPLPPNWTPGQPLPPNWTPGQPLPPNWSSGQPLPPNWTPGQPLPPNWMPGQPLPPNWSSGQPLPPNWTPGQPLPPSWASGQPFPPSWDQTLPPNWNGVGMPMGSWDDAPLPGSSFGLDNPAMWTGNPDTMSYGADPRLFQQLPGEIPAQIAPNLLYPINFNQISAGFYPDEFRGLPGTYMGFAPGLSYHLLRRCRYLYAGGVFIPFIYSGHRYVPVVLVSPRHRLYIYPSLIYIGGSLVPIYHSAPYLFEPFSQAFPVNFGPVWSSPLDILQVPGPIVHRPIILRKHRYHHAPHEVYNKVRFFKTFRPKIGLARHKIAVVRTKVHVRQKIRYRR